MLATIGSRPFVIVLLDSAGKFTRVGDALRVRHWLETGETLAVPAAGKGREGRQGEGPRLGDAAPVQARAVLARGETREGARGLSSEPAAPCAVRRRGRRPTNAVRLARELLMNRRHFLECAAAALAAGAVPRVFAADAPRVHRQGRQDR